MTVLTRRSTYGLDIGADDDWRLRAACRGYDPEWWTIGSRSDTAQAAANRRAVQICGGCPVRLRCAEFGLETKSIGLIFGGRRYGEGTRPVHCRRCRRLFRSRGGGAVYCGPPCREAAARDRAAS